ncbi:MAG TPA: fumarylacetoacetate hydrolase family protein [Solirubrobacteraceae bacterium]
MRLRSIFYGGEAAVALERDDGTLARLPEIDAIGPDTPLRRLRELAEKADQTLDPAEVTMRPVVPHPRRVICVGLNYRAHVDEGPRDLPTYPVLFTKWASSLVADGAPVVLPPEENAADYEAELAVVIGERGRRIPPEHTLEHVAGFTIANDVSMREHQNRSHQWLQGKAWDSSTPLGPALVTLEELDDPLALDISLELNGEQMQSSNTSLLIFDLPTLIAAISQFTELEPGDVILTGTPGGVGLRRDPPVALHDGDVMRVSIGGLGVLENRVLAETL